MKNVKTILLTVIMIATTIVGAVGQEVITKSELSSKDQKKYKEVLALSRKGKADKALKNLDKLLSKYPTFIDGYLRKSGLLYNMGDLSGSIAQLDKAISMDADYNPEMHYSLGTLYKEEKDYPAAAAAYKNYIDRAAPGERMESAKTYFAQTSFAAQAIANPVPYKPYILPGEVNSDHLEYIPALTIDGQQMIFTRRVGGQEDLYIADLIDGEFINARPITELNTPYNEGVHTISGDGRRIIFTASNRVKETVGGSDLFTSYRTSDGWSRPVNMGSVINTPAWDAQPSLSADGQTLYWSSSRNYGHGGNDIWTSTRTDSTGWNEPTPLSSSINSQYSEESPFIHPDGKTLYFRSNRPISMGGFDIYYSRYSDSLQTWLPAINIGYPINTEDSEGAMSVSLDGTTAYFATDQGTGEDGKQKNLNIFTFELYEEARPQQVTYVKTVVTDLDTGLPVRAKIELVNLDDNLQQVVKKTDVEGRYLGSVLAGHTYGLFVSAPGYVYHSENISLLEMRASYDPYILDVKLQPIVAVEVSEKDTTESAPPMILRNVFFETGSAVLSDMSAQEIDRLAATLSANRELEIEILGHTDNVGSATENLKLSEQRAKSVVEALVTKGIDRGRLSYRGYGETRPVADNDTEDGRRTNRRTEFKIKR